MVVQGILAAMLVPATVFNQDWNAGPEPREPAKKSGVLRPIDKRG